MTSKTHGVNGVGSDDHKPAKAADCDMPGKTLGSAALVNFDPMAAIRPSLFNDDSHCRTHKL